MAPLREKPPGWSIATAAAALFLVVVVAAKMLLTAKVPELPKGVVEEPAHRDSVIDIKPGDQVPGPPLPPRLGPFPRPGLLPPPPPRPPPP